MQNKIIAAFALSVLLGFLGILLVLVPRFDLGFVILLTAGMAVYDFFFHNRKTNGS